MLSKSKYVVLSIYLMFVSDFPSIGSNGRERKREREKERKREREKEKERSSLLCFAFSK